MQNTLASASPARHEARTPYRALAIAAAIVAFAGFARSYYLKGLFGARPLPVTLLAPASARIALLFTHSVVSQFLAFYACLGACVVVDTVRHQRLHPVFGWGTLFIVAAWQLVYALEKSDAWLPLVSRIFGS